MIAPERLQGISSTFLLLIFFPLTPTYLSSTTPSHTFNTFPSTTNTLQSTNNTLNMPKKADDATPKVTKAKKSTLPAIKWTANTDKFLLSTVIDLLTFGEIDGAVWQLAAERMGGEGSGYTADKIR